MTFHRLLRCIPVDMCILQFANYIHNFRKNNNNTIGNLTKKDPVCQFIRKLDGKPIPDPQRAFKPLLDVKPEEDVSHNHNYQYISFQFTVLIVFIFGIMCTICFIKFSFLQFLLFDFCIDFVVYLTDCYFTNTSAIITYLFSAL